MELLACFSKENGLLMFAYIGMIEIFIFKLKFKSRQEMMAIFIFQSVFFLIPAIIFIYLIFSGYFLAGYVYRPFDMTERLLTEARVFWFYITQILIPQANLFGLHHDDFTLSTDLFSPITTILSVTGILGLLLVCVYCFKRFVWISFGIAFFIVGHLMESTVIPLNLIHEHRNYLPSIGPLIIFILCIKFTLNKINSTYFNYFMFLFIALFSFVTMSRAYDWSDETLLAERLVQRHPESISSNYEAAYIYFKKYESTKNLELFEQSKRSFGKTLIL